MWKIFLKICKGGRSEWSRGWACNASQNYSEEDERCFRMVEKMETADKDWTDSRVYQLRKLKLLIEVSWKESEVIVNNI